MEKSLIYTDYKKVKIIYRKLGYDLNFEYLSVDSDQLDELISNENISSKIKGLKIKDWINYDELNGKFPKLYRLSVQNTNIFDTNTLISLFESGVRILNLCNLLFWDFDKENRCLYITNSFYNEHTNIVLDLVNKLPLNRIYTDCQNIEILEDFLKGSKIKITRLKTCFGFE